MEQSGLITKVLEAALSENPIDDYEEKQYAGFYANLTEFYPYVMIMFYVEFSLLLLMTIILYALHIREQRKKN